MSERQQYYDRQEKALQSEDTISIISDGMQQSHCLLPHLGNQRQFGSCLNQHIQGVLVHGRSFTAYR